MADVPEIAATPIGNSTVGLMCLGEGCDWKFIELATLTDNLEKAIADHKAFHLENE